MLQAARRYRCAMSLKIAWRSAAMQGARSERDALQLLVAAIFHSDGKIKTLAGNVEHPVGKLDIHAQRRMACRQPVDDRHDCLFAIRDGASKADMPAKHGIFS